MKGREFKGSYTAKDFVDYCFAFDDEGSPPWEESMHAAYGALREHVESSFADTPWPAFILGCEAQFGISEEFFEELFSPRLRCYSSEAFFGDGSCLLLERGVKEKLIELVSKTTAFDKAIADGKAFFPPGSPTAYTVSTTRTCRPHENCSEPISRRSGSALRDVCGIEPGHRFRNPVTRVRKPPAVMPQPAREGVFPARSLQPPVVIELGNDEPEPFPIKSYLHTFGIYMSVRV